MKKKISKIYFLLLNIATVILLVGLLWGKTNVHSRIESLQTRQIYPVKEMQLTENLKEYYLEVESLDGVSLALEIYSGHQAVRVYAEEELIYALEGADSLWGSTSGAKYNFIEIPVATRDIKVEVEAIYEEDRERELEFFVGDAIGMFRGYVRGAIPNVIMSFLSIVMGIFLIGYWLITGRRAKTRRGSLYFGVFAMILGGWTLHETDFSTVLVGNRTAASFCGYLLLMLAIVPFVLFVKEFMEVDDRWLYAVICIGAMVNLVVNVFGHMTGLWYFRKTVITIHISIGAGLAYMLYAVFWRRRKYGMDRKVQANIVGAVVLIATVVIDVSAYYMNLKQTDVIGRFGLLVYILLLGKETVVEFFEQIDEGRKAEIYKELAEKDVMTSLYNRNAFDEWECNYKDLANTMVVTFDLNNLKQCNDTMGHDVGDRYIIDAAGLISKVFGKFGKCYRIGGDEFCAIILNADRVNIETQLLHLRKLQDYYNRKSKDVNMHIACGYAAFDEMDLNMKGTRSRADARMYANKKEIKVGK